MTYITLRDLQGCLNFQQKFTSFSKSLTYFLNLWNRCLVLVEITKRLDSTRQHIRNDVDGSGGVSTILGGFVFERGEPNKLSQKRIKERWDLKRMNIGLRTYRVWQHCKETEEIVNLCKDHCNVTKLFQFIFLFIHLNYNDDTKKIIHIEVLVWDY